jgi:hypothetical protein
MAGLATFAASAELMETWTASQSNGTYDRLRQLELTQPDWNGLGSEPPTSEAISHATSVLAALGVVRPERVTASAEGGVAMTFRREHRFASIETLNSGEIIVLESDGNGNPHAREIDASDQSLQRIAQELREYLNLG